ncbi:DNA cytosine methyltransferase [Xenorhabdus griffiniae]|nr:DNA cytosine methyltransferase [Xenorhabdus griffiniae]KLU15578.1 methyltransferase [Xenorhabdus griffiniae]
MTAYYNEIDPYAAQWLRNLIAAGHIAPGDVDERSIEDVRPDDLRGYKQCHFFAGIGVWSYALRNAGWPDDKSVWTGSCPCQPFSAAGKRSGFTDERHLWPYFHYLIGQCRPGIIFGEQVASKDGLAWFDLVQADLAGTGYTSAAVDLCAAGVGAPHIRQRLYWVGHTNDTMPQGLRRYKRLLCEKGRQDSERLSVSPNVVTHVWNGWKASQGADEKIRIIPSGYGETANRTAGRVGRLCAYGNAIVAPVAEEFIKAYMQGV